MQSTSAKAAPFTQGLKTYERPPLTMLEQVRGWVCNLLLIVSVFVSFWPAFLSVAVSRPFGKKFSARVADTIVVYWAHLVCLIYGVRVEVEGLENIEADQTYVLVANHRSNFDAMAILTGLFPKLTFGFVVKKSLMQIPLWGWYIWFAGYVPIDRKKQGGAKAQMAAASENVRAGRSVLIFAEGTRAKGHAFLPFKRGAALLASGAGVPALPVTVSGTMDIVPSGALVARGGTIRVTIGTPIAPADQTREQFTKSMRHAVASAYRETPDGPTAADVPGGLDAILGGTK